MQQRPVDADDDLFIFNGDDWNVPYLGQLRSDGGVLTVSRRFDAVIPGWQMAPGDTFIRADTQNDGQDDLYVYNGFDWNVPYLGTLVSTDGNDLDGSWQTGLVGGWPLFPANQIMAGNFNGGGGWEDVFIMDNAIQDFELFGLLQSQGGRVSAGATYPQWITQHPFHVLGWW